MTYLLLIIYVIVFIVFVVVSGLGFYHLWRYGYHGDVTKVIMVGYTVIMAMIIVFSIVIMLTLEWGDFKFNFQDINIKLFSK